MDEASADQQSSNVVEAAVQDPAIQETASDQLSEFDIFAINGGLRDVNSGQRLNPDSATPPADT